MTADFFRARLAQMIHLMQPLAAQIAPEHCTAGCPA